MIKAKFENIGPIKNAKLELGDLTIIAGQNNTGKTYLVYTLYSFLDFWKNSDIHAFYEFAYPPELYKQTEKIARQISETGVANIDFKEYERINHWIIRKTTDFFSKQIIHQAFSSSRDKFERAHFQFEETEVCQLTDNAVYIRNNKGQKASIRYFLQDNVLKFKIDNPEYAKFPGILRGPNVLFEKMAQNNCPKSFILSAERFGISLFYRELDFTKNRLVEELQNLSGDKHFDPFRFIEKQSARYAKPIKDNIDFTRDLQDIQKYKSELTADGTRLIERMVDGYYKVEKGEVKFISKRRGENRFVIPLHLASSSARGLSDLYFYLKHLAAPGQILIIDEPESHLSPTNQVLVARLLAFCVNEGLKVLITTHSDYIIKEIDNLIMLHSNFKEEENFLKKHKKQYTKKDRLNPRSVKAYICEDGGLRQCKIDKKGIDSMSVFDDAINSINKIYAELDMWMDMDDSKDD